MELTIHYREHINSQVHKLSGKIKEIREMMLLMVGKVEAECNLKYDGKEMMH